MEILKQKVAIKLSTKEQAETDFESLSENDKKIVMGIKNSKKGETILFSTANSNPFKILTIGISLR